ncbi:RNA polymerase, sigma 54 subunit, RpoN/SigL [Caloramator quimbayensis]|uniref:RNA polymerase, sigma 54 subunit, RpoN/SigL n=1 Tax=Caloramator quimbayensis TaxID=1147123 RepID=A0A1T4XWI8_9CLOT|nr:RNA polymerase factor sigma-54 [Caloramator quimbayensis]SKA93568.1 RNA polymerase, sigma 54 subunit, RpoN/SigL [Caloramator quimbayensis]
MKLDYNLKLQQEQRLIMTQELQLAVKLLQLNSVELNEYVEEQLIENPLLERDEKEKEEKEDKEEIIDFINYLDEYRDEEQNFDEDKEYISPLNFVIKQTSLWDYLKEQLMLSPINKIDRKIGDFVIDCIDENGYLTTDINEISKKLNVNIENVERIISLIQTFEPSGVCSRDIKECLIIQLKNRDIDDPILENIINTMLQEVGEGNIIKIAKENGISNEKALEYINIIKTLDPKPGVRYSSDETKYIVPDVILEKIDGKYVVTVNEDCVPNLKINSLYRKLINNKNCPEYNYVKEKLSSALWLIKSIEQRIETIKKVVTAIVEYQIDFFEYGSDLKPLTLKQIADITSLHESTVSRAVKGKYIQTPKGLFEIKNFFIKGIQTKTGEDISTVRLKERIKEIIKSENIENPLSDQQIADKMNNEGLNISRRTVAKYREEMNIPSSSKRKNNIKSYNL